jgi:hypothetical protein
MKGKKAFVNKLPNGLLNIGLIGLGCVLSVAVLEIGLRIFWHPELESWQSNLNATFSLDDDVTTGVIGPAHIVTNSRGIRGTEWFNDRSREFRVLAIGGSTTECLAQDQPNTWTAQLQARMPETKDGRRVWVGNAGRGGHLSIHHVLAMRYMPNQYDPDMVVILVGINEVGALLNQGPNYDPNFIDNDGKMRELAWDFYEQPTSLLNEGGLSKHNAYSWMYFKEFRNRFFGLTARGIVQTVDAYRALRERRRHAWLIVDEMPDLQPGLDGYRHNLMEIIRLAHERNVHLVFMSQPALYKQSMSPDEVGRLWSLQFAFSKVDAYWSPRVWTVALEAFNRVLIETCQEKAVDCIDLAMVLPRTTEVFWDQCHFTDHGSNLVADELVRYLKAYFEKTQK